MNRVARIRVIAFATVLSVILFSGVCATGYAAPLLDGNITLTKTGSPTTFAEVGEVITYTYVLENTSGYYIYDISITDDLIDDIDCPKSELSSGAITTCTGEYTITEEDLQQGEVTNKASASGEYSVYNEGCCGCGGDYEYYPASASDRFTVNAEEPAAGISLEKTGSPTTFTAAGQEIAYTYTVSNTGEEEITGPVTVEDNKVDVICPTGGIPTGESMTCNATYTTTETDVENGSVVNTATASASGVDSNEASFEVTLAGSPGLSLSKESDSNIYQYANDILRYSFTLTNTGNVPLSAPFVINDPLLDEFRCTFPDTIAVGSSFGTECYGYYRIRAGDVGDNILNCATATGIYEGETITSAEACAESQYVAPPEAPPEPQGVCDTNPGSEDCCTENPEHESCSDY
jgi:uncharacterized repeat protein (TIGR01451 family)